MKHAGSFFDSFHCRFFELVTGMQKQFIRLVHLLLVSPVKFDSIKSSQLHMHCPDLKKRILGCYLCEGFLLSPLSKSFGQMIQLIAGRCSELSSLSLGAFP